MYLLLKRNIINHIPGCNLMKIGNLGIPAFDTP